MVREMNDKQKVEQFIAKATGKTIGRSKKLELAILFANTYTEYVKTHKELSKGYAIYKAMKSQRDWYHTLLRRQMNHAIK